MANHKQKEAVNPFETNGKLGDALGIIREFPPERLHNLIYVGCAHAAIVSVGTTRDMGSVQLSVLYNGKLNREYAPTAQRFDELVTILEDWFIALDK